ncbi:hypothetical protein LWI28_011745 [Acer negundo]|uniref:Uncharacterized protein n=1 Tax=Acer negundo TaxID=4023 RepID=A0AAD5IYN1_ACENE|nr:hypothetical protein LWI28_011745 [Acer negundo]KAK4848389.1 hypothetical protein QYF36_012338 [Acer negundo]
MHASGSSIDTLPSSSSFSSWWRRLVQFKSLATLWRSSAPSNLWWRSLTSSSPLTTTLSSHRTSFLFSHQVASASDKNLKKKVEDKMPIATGHKLEGINILQINHPIGPFGSKNMRMSSIISIVGWFAIYITSVYFSCMMLFVY